MQPLRQELFPQPHARADYQCSAEPLRNSDVMARLFERSDDSGGVTLKLPAGRCQRGARLVADKERASELLFEGMNSRTNSRLADVKPLCGINETSRRNDGEESSGKFGVHRDAS